MLKYLFTAIFGMITLSSCWNSTKFEKEEVLGNYGDRGWNFQFNSTLDLKNYWEDSSNTPENLKKSLAEEAPWDGTVYCKKATGEIGVGLWSFGKRGKWGLNTKYRKIFIRWQETPFGLGFYRDGEWYFATSISRFLPFSDLKYNHFYFTAGAADLTIGATWPKQ
jgi:hypothetical protein